MIGDKMDIPSLNIKNYQDLFINQRINFLEKFYHHSIHLNEEMMLLSFSHLEKPYTIASLIKDSINLQDLTKNYFLYSLQKKFAVHKRLFQKYNDEIRKIGDNDSDPEVYGMFAYCNLKAFLKNNDYNHLNSAIKAIDKLHSFKSLDFSSTFFPPVLHQEITILKSFKNV